MPTYPEEVPLILPGDRLTPDNANKSAKALIERTDWLYFRLQELTSGTQFDITIKAPVGSNVIVGTPVYYNRDQNLFEPASAKTTVVDQNALPHSTIVIGVVEKLYPATGEADIVIVGTIKRDSVSAWTSNFVGAAPSAGPVYLSDTAGKLQTAPTAAGLLVGILRTNGELIVSPSRTTAYIQHKHNIVTLIGKPAGTVTNTNPMAITPNLSERGWLPSSSFLSAPYNLSSSQIPATAKFGYHYKHASDQAAEQALPFLAELNQAFLSILTSTSDASLIPSGRLLINEYGYWWTSDQSTQVPWDQNYQNNSLYRDVVIYYAVPTGASTQQNQSTLNGVIKISSEDDSITITGTQQFVNTMPYKYAGDVTLKNNGVTRIQAGLGISISSSNTQTPGRGVVTVSASRPVPLAFIGSNASSVPVLIKHAVDNAIYAAGYPISGEPSLFSSTNNISYSVWGLYLGDQEVPPNAPIPSLKLNILWSTPSNVYYACHIDISVYNMLTLHFNNTTQALASSTVTLTQSPATQNKIWTAAALFSPQMPLWTNNARYLVQLRYNPGQSNHSAQNRIVIIGIIAEPLMVS